MREDRDRMAAVDFGSNDQPGVRRRDLSARRRTALSPDRFFTLNQDAMAEWSWRAHTSRLRGRPSPLRRRAACQLAEVGRPWSPIRAMPAHFAPESGYRAALAESCLLGKNVFAVLRRHHLQHLVGDLVCRMDRACNIA